ncbi:MAG: ROK family protein [Candidatus Niyogibacteria bacterium]|nr:ROK family protein [Candidatus Niyogibacteria bacterium]
MYYLGFDIGASTIKAVLVKNKKILRHDVSDTPRNLRGLSEVIFKMSGKLRQEAGTDKLGGIGIAVAGVMDSSRSKVLVSPNMPYLNGQPLRRLVAKKLKYPKIVMEHDVHCFLLAEKAVGRAKNLKNVFYLTVGSGIGGAWMADGRIGFGSHGAAGEVGHMITAFDKNGTFDLEDVASNKFIKNSLGIGFSEAFRRAKQGDKHARQIFGDLGANLGVGIANIINIFDPETVILSGGIAEAKTLLLSGIKKGVFKFVISPQAKRTKIIFSKLGRLGGALGAAFMAEQC